MTHLPPGEAISYPFADFPEEGSTIEVADGIFWISLPVPFVGLRQVNAWLLRDGDGWTMIDAGHGDAPTEARLKKLWAGTLGGKPVTRLILTHFHPDHAGGSAFVAEQWGGLLPLMSQAEWFAANLAIRNAYTDHIGDRSAFHQHHGLDQARADMFQREVLIYADGVRLPPAYRRMQDGEQVKIGGDSWQVICGQGHSPEHVSLYCAARKILIAGDQILPSITTNVSVWPLEPEADPLRLFLQSCQRFYGILDQATLVLPSHRKPFTQVHTRLRELDHHHAERLSVVLAAATEPVSAGSLLDVMFHRPLDGHQVGFAMGEALAHLNHLVARGLMARLPVSDGTQFFQRLRDAPDHVGTWFS